MSYTNAQVLSSGTGMPGLQAGNIGRTVSTIAGAGTTQALGALLQTGQTTTVLGTTAASQTAFVFPANTPIGDSVEFICTTATTAVLYPEVGSALNAAAANASVSIAQSKSALFVRTSATQWWSFPVVPS